VLLVPLTHIARAAYATMALVGLRIEKGKALLPGLSEAHCSHCCVFVRMKMWVGSPTTYK